MANTDPSKNEDDPHPRIPMWVVLLAAVAFNAGGLLLLTVDRLADIGVPVLVLGLVALWELTQRRRRRTDEDTHRGMLNTIAAMLLLATVVFVVAAVVPAAADAVSFGTVILLLALGFGLYDAWTWWKELRGQTEAGSQPHALERQKRTALVLLASLVAVGVIGLIAVLILSPGPLFLLAIALPLAATAAGLALLRSRGGSSGRPW